MGDEEYPGIPDEGVAPFTWRAHPIANSPDEGGVWVGSEHPGIVHVILGDGSGKGLNKDTDILILEAMVTREGGEVIEESF